MFSKSFIHAQTRSMLNKIPPLENYKRGLNSYVADLDVNAMH